MSTAICAPSAKRFIPAACSAADAPQLVDDALARVDLGPDTTLVVLHGRDLPTATPVGPAVAAGVPPALDDQVVVTATGPGAGAWLDAATGIVLADAGELLVPAVARRAAQVGTVLLSGAVRDAPAPLTEPPATRPRVATPALVPWVRAGQVATELRTLRGAGSLDTLVLHRPAAASD